MLLTFIIEGKAKFQLGVSENKEVVFVFFFPMPVFESHAFHPSTLGRGDLWAPREEALAYFNQDSHTGAGRGHKFFSETSGLFKGVWKLKLNQVK